MIAAMARGHRGRSRLKGRGDPATMSGPKAACRGAAYLNNAMQRTRDKNPTVLIISWSRAADRQRSLMGRRESV